ncbi:MAG: CDP-diacylglycerol--serine O-phosphatidyltransferase [Leptospirillia bacterium]
MENGTKRRGIYLIPNLLTTCNIIAGFYCVVAAYQGKFEHAGFAIVAAGIFDILDGRVARAMGLGSRFGVEYDSLADLISFGVAPAFLMYSWALEGFGRIGWAAACLYLVCCALRLARYNVSQSDDPGTKAKLFTGLPSPGAAGMICATVLFETRYGLIGEAMPGISLFLVFMLSFLLVSTVPYGRGQTAEPHPFLNLVSGVLILIAVVAEPHLVLFLIGVTYTSSGLIRWVVLRRRGAKARVAAEHDPAA